MSESQSHEVVTRPVLCPFCQSKAIDTFAKVITAAALWRCRGCERTWTIASRAASPPRPLSTFRLT
jgi:ribosomal protein L37AE/L43A